MGNEKPEEVFNLAGGRWKIRGWPGGPRTTSNLLALASEMKLESWEGVSLKKKKKNYKCKEPEVQNHKGLTVLEERVQGGKFSERFPGAGSLRTLWVIRRLEFILRALGSHGRVLSKGGLQ